MLLNVTFFRIKATTYKSIKRFFFLIFTTTKYFVYSPLYYINVKKCQQNVYKAQRNVNEICVEKNNNEIVLLFAHRFLFAVRVWSHCEITVIGNNTYGDNCSWPREQLQKSPCPLSWYFCFCTPVCYFSHSVIVILFYFPSDRVSGQRSNNNLETRQKCPFWRDYSL